MIGTDATTGKPLGGLDHILQSVGNILATPIGSRVMRRGYGSRIPELLDQPATDATAVRLYAATADALMRWEPRLQITRVQLQRQAGGRAQLSIDAYRLDVPQRTGPQTINVSLTQP